MIGKDEEWAETGGKVRERTVKVTGLDAHRIEHPLGEARVWHVPSYDVALLTVNVQGMKTVPLADRVPRKNASLVALLWGPTGVPQAITATLLETDRSQHGNVLTVQLKVVEGNSGSGLFDAEFRLTGIILNRVDDQRALAVPIAFIRPLLPPSCRDNAVAPKNPRKLARKAESALNSETSPEDLKLWNERLEKAVRARPLNWDLARVKSFYDTSVCFRLDDAIITIKTFVSYKKTAGDKILTTN